MKKYPNLPSPIAVMFASLLFVSITTAAFAQLSPTVADQEKEAANKTAQNAKQEVVELEKFTVSTGYRSPKSIDQIPGAVRLITTQELSNMLLLNDDPTAILAQTIPGYTQSTQQMQNTSETLRGRQPLRLLDGVSQSTPIRDGSRNGTFTDMGIIDHIEVINGPSAAEGMGAAGGIINYITKTATKEGSEAIITTRIASQGRTDNTDTKAGIIYTNKRGNTDILLSAAYIDRNMMYDANGRLVGMGASGSYMDTSESQFFVKVGHNFGKNNTQRLVFSTNQFFIQGKGNYTPNPVGNRALGITDTSHKVPALGAKAVINEFNQYTLAYNNNDLFGGSLNVQLYKADQAMRFQASSTDSDKQDPLIAPLGTLLEQSEIYSTKKGIRSSWGREDFIVEGLELNVGFDLLDELTGQNLALTNRIWAPPMNYVSKAPFTQVSFAKGPITVSGGMRQENGSLHVDSFTTTYFRKRAFVTGGTLKYKSNLPNIGVIVRLPKGWSTFASYSKGFTLPNIGITLRNVSVPGVRVDTLLDLQAVLVDNKEIGLSWRGSKVSFSGSVYKSYSDFGSNLVTDPTLGNYIVVRQPVEIQGGELSGEVNLRKGLKLTMLYSHIIGKTGAATTTVPALQTRMGIASISPDKFNASLKWQYSPKLMFVLDQAATFGREINVGKSTYENTHGSTLYNFTAGYSTKWGDFSLGIENLLNKFYIMDWSQVDQFQNYFAGRGRNFSLTYRLRF